MTCASSLLERMIWRLLQELQLVSLSPWCTLPKLVDDMTHSPAQSQPVNFQEFFKNLNLPQHSIRRMYDWSTTPSNNLVPPIIILFNNKAQFFLWHERCWRQESQFEVHDLLKMLTLQNNWRVTYSPHKCPFYSFFYRFKKFLRCHCTTSIIEPAP